MSDSQFTISPAAGVTPGIGYMLAEMDDVREQLRNAVETMPDALIAARAVPGAHSIGALVLHIGEAEWWWIKCVIQGHEPTDEDNARLFWDALEDPEGFAAKCPSGRECLEAVERIRDDTRQFLATLNDDDLDKTYSRIRSGKETNYSLRWILHHLIDHEAQHKGQILMLKRLLGPVPETSS